MTFSQWLRENSEHYLLCEAQDKMARRTGTNPPNKPRGMKDRFWRQLVIPIYHMMPWGMKKWFMDVIPGSHKRHWPRKNFRSKQ
ncbi:hypothetical protein RUESEDTHA_03738 [Ruegeria sp. THAF57]|nr:hypothetical protein RUESEDTHA_03738 [Ruegeria sp. THAF57]